MTNGIGKHKPVSKSEIARHIRDSVAGVSLRQANEIVNAALDAVTMHLSRGDSVRIPAFGAFSVSERSSRVGRNPKTGAVIRIAASKAVRFTSSKKLRSKVQRQGGR